MKRKVSLEEIEIQDIEISHAKDSSESPLRQVSKESLLVDFTKKFLLEQSMKEMLFEE